MVMAAVSLLEEHPNPSEADVREGLAGGTSAVAPATTTS
jgi:aerobic-type carbon monoxide dehydrogenase small subunit (CoxS/CutS family)